MKCISTLSIAVAGAMASTLTAEPLHKFLEPDVQLVISARSLAETHAEWETHSLAKIYEDESLQVFLDEFSKAKDAADGDDKSTGFIQVMEDEFNLSVEDFLELFPGEIAMAFYNITDDILNQGEPTEAVLMAEFSGDADRMSELMQIQFERNAKMQKEHNPLIEHVLLEEQFMGETLYMDETFDGEKTYIEDGFALVDGIFVLATEERLRRAVELIKEGGDSLFESEMYERALEESGGGDLRLFINLETLIAPLNKAMLANVAQGGLAMFGVTAQSLESALSLESLQAAFIDLELVEQGVSLHSGLLYSEKAGLLRLLTYADSDLPEATYTPEGVLGATISNLDISEMLAELQKILALASPSVPLLLDIQLQKVKTETGVDLRASILENFSGDVVSLSVMKEASRDGEIPLPEQTYVMEIKDGEALSQALEAIKDLTPGMRDAIETQEYEGQTIHTIKAQPNPQQPDAPLNDVSYVITRSEFVLNIGRIGLLQEVLTRMASSDRGFWQLEKTEDLFESIAKPNPVTRSFIDFDQMVGTMLKSALTASTLGRLGSQMDLSKLPSSLDVPLVMISESNEFSDGIFMRALLIESLTAE